jgi:hypothetical protein
MLQYKRKAAAYLKAVRKVGKLRGKVTVNFRELQESCHGPYSLDFIQICGSGAW